MKKKAEASKQRRRLKTDTTLGVYTIEVRRLISFHDLARIWVNISKPDGNPINCIGNTNAT
jgi:hypothetical protein